MKSLIIKSEDQGKVVAVCLLCTLLTIMPVGYHIVVLNVPSTVIQNFYAEAFREGLGVELSARALSILWSLTIASQAIGALIGCSLVSSLAPMGSKVVILTVNNCILAAGSILMATSYYFSFPPIFLIGRMMTGVYSGIACAFVPLFVQQIVPKNIKGSLSCFLHIAVCFGSSLGAVLSLPFVLGSATSWPILVSLPAIFGIVLMFASSYIPDTPNTLLQQGKYTKAIESIRFYYDIACDDEDEAIGMYWDMVPEMPTQLTFWEAWRDGAVRGGMLLGMMVSAAQIFSGSMVSISYSTVMFDAVAFMDFLVPFLPALGSILSIVLTIPALHMVESKGRRPLLLKTLILCVISNIFFLIFTLVSQVSESLWASWGFALAFLMYGVGYNLGVGPVAYFLPAELVPPEAASASLGAAVAVNWFCTSLTTLFFYPLSVSIGGWSYIIFIVPTSLFLLILWPLLPETKFHYKEDPLEARLLYDLGPTLPPYGSLNTSLF